VAQDRKHSRAVMKNKSSCLGEGVGGLFCSKTTFKRLGTITSNTCGNVSCHSGRDLLEYWAVCCLG
jgi:hypothetical protein